MQGIEKAVKRARRVLHAHAYSVYIRKTNYTSAVSADMVHAHQLVSDALFAIDEFMVLSRSHIALISLS